MKVIVSTKEFARVIRMSIKYRVQWFSYYKQVGKIVFDREAKLYLDITPFYEDAEDCCCYKFPFDYYQMIRVYNFLRTLPEQKITVYFRDYDNKMSIELSQFVINF